MPRQSDLNTKNLLCTKPNSYAIKNTQKTFILEATRERHDELKEPEIQGQEKSETELFGNIIYMRILLWNRPDVASMIMCIALYKVSDHCWCYIDMTGRT